MAEKSRRELLKATATGSLKKAAEDDEQYLASGKGGEFHKFDQGLNKFRIYPKHKGEEAFYKLLGVHWGTVEGDDGKPQRRKIADGKLHGGLSKDPIEAFIAFCAANLDGDDADEKGKLDALVDSKDGIQLKISWVCYADKIVAAKPIFGVMEFKKTVRDRINEESNVDGAEEAIDLDPFTDADDGLPLIIDYDSKAKSGNKYFKSVRLGKTAIPLTDEQVDYYLDNVKPLSKLGLFQYGEKEFETGLEILRFADEANDINLFDSEEFQAIVKGLKKELKNRGKSTKSAADEDEVPAPAKKKKPAVEEEEEEEAPAPTKKKKAADVFGAMDRDELKEYISENELPLGVKKAWSDDELRDQIRAIVAPAKPAKKAAVEEEEEAPAPVKKKKPVPPVDDDDAPPPPKKKKPVVEDEDEPAPKKKPTKKPVEEDEDEDEPASKVSLKNIKKKLREEDEDED